MTATAVPAIEGWFTTGDEPRLLGSRCTECGTVSFPKATGLCRNPGGRGRGPAAPGRPRPAPVGASPAPRSQPPPPYVPASDPFEPFALAAVELPEDGLVVLGQVAAGFGVEDLRVGAPVELVVEPQHEIDGVPQLIYRWRPTGEVAS